MFNESSETVKVLKFVTKKLNYIESKFHLMTDLRIGQIGHGLGSRAFGAPRNSFLWRLIKFWGATTHKKGHTFALFRQMTK